MRIHLHLSLSLSLSPSLSLSCTHEHAQHREIHIVNTISMLLRSKILKLKQSQFVNLIPSTKTIPAFLAIISLIFAPQASL